MREDCNRVDQRDEFAQRVDLKAGHRAVYKPAATGCCEVSPFKSHSEAAKLAIAQDHRVDTADASRPQCGESLASTRMKGMPDLSPSE